MKSYKLILGLLTLVVTALLTFDSPKSAPDKVLIKATYEASALCNVSRETFAPVSVASFAEDLSYTGPDPKFNRDAMVPILYFGDNILAWTDPYLHRSQKWIRDNNAKANFRQYKSQLRYTGLAPNRV